MEKIRASIPGIGFVVMNKLNEVKLKPGRTELTQDRTTNEYGMVVYLGTKSETVAKRRAERIIKNYNKFLKKKRKKMEKRNEQHNTTR